VLWVLASGFVGGAIRAAALCDELPAAELVFAAHAEPAEPAVGDVVELQIEITSSTGGRADIPLFRLLGVEPWLVVEAQENSYPSTEFVRYRLRAVRAGEAAPWVAVSFATAVGCADDPIAIFRSASSPPYPLAVRGAAVTASATPTATATPSLPTPSDATLARTSAASRRR
jgi:hypothetical protein